MEIKQQTLGIWSTDGFLTRACVGARSKFAWKLSVFQQFQANFERKLRIKGKTLRATERERKKSKDKKPALPLVNVNNWKWDAIYVKLDEHSLNALNHVDFMRTLLCVWWSFSFSFIYQMCFPLENSLTWKYFYYEQCAEDSLSRINNNNNKTRSSSYWTRNEREV